jgi:hypothetical protein
MTHAEAVEVGRHIADQTQENAVIVKRTNRMLAGDGYTVVYWYQWCGQGGMPPHGHDFVSLIQPN